MDSAVSSTPPESGTGMRAHRRAFTIVVVRAVVASIALLVIYFVLPLGTGDQGPAASRGVAAVVMLLVVVAGQTLAVGRSDTPALRAVEAIAISLTLLLVTAAAIYLGISGSNPEAFTEPLEHVDGLYLSMMTMTTVGFGDIGALSQGARIAVMTQLVLNVLILGTAVRTMMGRAQAGVQKMRSAGDPSP